MRPGDVSTAVQEPTIAKHSEPFVRTAALVATAQVIRAIPPPLLAGALLRGDSAQSDALFSGRLQQLQDSLREEYAALAVGDRRRDLVGGCLALQAELAEEAMVAMESSATLGGDVDLLQEGRQSGDILLPPW